jgi:AbiV family abortive infection protein
MSKRASTQYRGHLSSAQVAEGMNAARLNAVRLSEDAKLLLDSGRFATAASIAVLSLEESGKPMILLRLLTCITDAELHEVWKAYRKHTEKNILGLLPGLLSKGADTPLQALRPLFSSDTELERARFDVVKQLGFYTDYCGDKANWYIPVETIDAGLATALVSFARALAQKKEEMTEQELNLWMAHMQKGNNRSNLLKWAASMVEAGLKPKGYAEDMARFTQGL